METKPLTIAETIMSQLGGGIRLVEMIGVKFFVDTGKGLKFNFRARAKDGINCVIVELNGRDLYDVEFWSIRGTSMKQKEKMTDIYAEDLKRTIERRTGLALSLF